MESRSIHIGTLPAIVGNTDKDDTPLPRENTTLGDVTTSSWGCVFTTLALFFVYISFCDGSLHTWIVEGNPMLFVFIVLHVALFLRFVTVRRDPGFLDQVESRPLSDSDGEDSFPLRYCQYCNMYQPRRTRHCKECKRCILTFDHHCFWIGGCVGERNTVAFLQMLVLFSLALTWYYPLLCSTFVYAMDPLDYLYVNSLRIVMFLILFGFWMMVIGLLFFHLYLACTAQTTWENIRKHAIDYLKDFPREVLPFSRGALQNLHEVCMRSKEGYIRWKYTWVFGDEIPFSWFENKYWSCC